MVNVLEHSDPFDRLVEAWQNHAKLCDFMLLNEELDEKTKQHVRDVKAGIAKIIESLDEK